MSRARQIDPVVHHANARLVLLRDQMIGTGFIHGALVLNLHAVGFVEAVLDIGNDTAQLLQRLALFDGHKLPVNAVLQADKRLVKLNLRAVGTVVHIVEPS